MKLKNYIFLVFAGVIFYNLTACYTQVATNEPEPYSTTIIYEKDPETSNYYNEDGEELDSSYYSEIDPETDESVTVINKYYYPYDSYDYYPYFSIGIGLSWYWGWGSFSTYWPYYGYYPYYPYYSGYWGCGWYYPSYCYYPSYYYCDPYYYSNYYGYYPYYDYGYGYYPRDEYVTRTRNNSGGRNNNPEYVRDPLVTVSSGSINTGRDGINTGRDLTVDKNTVTDRSLGIQNSTNEITRQLVTVNDADRIKNTTRNDNTGNDKIRIKQKGNDKQPGLDRELTTKKSLGVNYRDNKSTETLKNKNRSDINDKINNSNRIGDQTKQLFNRNDSKKYGNTDTPTNKDTRNYNQKNVQKNNQTTRKDNNTRTYNPNKQQNNQPRTYTQPRGNNNTPRTYSPPSGNNTPRSYSPPTRTGGSNNSGGRRR